MSTIRRPGAASAAVLIGLSVSLVVAHALAPEWSRRAGLDVWNLAAVENDRRAAADERADVEAHAEQAERRRDAANQIAAGLVSGALTVPAATDEIAELFRGDAGMMVTLDCNYRTVPTTRLRFARHTIDRAARFLPDDPEQRAAVLARLEAEYQPMAAPPESPAAP